MKPVILPQKGEQHFFASANTAKGFANYYDEIFSGVSRVWYIKGGPGTGKSYMMKHIGAEATRRGHTALLYHCSSDPDSLDGVLIPEIGFGILDGTAPHVGDPRYPGAGDKIVDVGRFLDEGALCAKRGRIAELMAKKREAYRMAYAGLSAENALHQARRIALTPLVLQDKLTAFAERACREAGTGKWSQPTSCLVDAIGMGGRVHLATLEAVAKRILVVREQYGAGELVLDALAQAATRAGCQVVCSLDPLDPDRLTAVLLVATGDLYTLQPQAACTREIRTSRFLEQRTLAEIRPRLRALVRAERAVRETTDACFAEIRRLHFSLEAVYTAAMDLAGASGLLSLLLAEIFGEKARTNQ